MKKFKQWLAKIVFTQGRIEASKIKKAEPAKIDDLFRAAYKKFSSAASFDADNAEVLHYWGSVLYEQSQYKEGKEVKELCQGACEKFGAALKLDPNNAEIMNDWGAALISRARNRPDKHAVPFYREAWEKINAAEALKPGVGAYNLACIYSLQGDLRQSKMYIEQARAADNLPPVAYLKMDRDLDNIRDEEWFKHIIQSLIKEEEIQSQVREAEKKQQNKPWWRRLKRQKSLS
ncbi:hypothetical conserved protein [Candidatus Nitrosoglobus terrae]|uniref:Hypothetical conserved protein n=1 Tax=Candidatus Nitrosoglobus terrae TaxID=1630141 RepID=A0A1Q2SLE6_9GAMM|nr:hypothetical protein [Candidatus Nitrosoglobus terrae]BAW79961.1 hypothetical conserved protein [Candidatus Nitrosoglobus terrae]